MSLKELHLPATIEPSSANMAADFYMPALSISVRYDREAFLVLSGCEWWCANPFAFCVAG